MTRRPGFAARLLLAQALVLLAGAATSWMVASLVAPGIFHMHLREAGVTHTPEESTHVERAFGDALLISFGVALVASVALALAVTWYFTHRVQRSIAAVTDSAEQVAAGRYRERVPSAGLGGEFDRLAETFNFLAARLEDVESTRRRMLADLAHEMRNPLATIEAHLEALEDGVAEPDAATLGVLRSSTARLSRLAEDIATVSRAQEAGVEIHPVATTLETVARSAARAAHEAYRSQGVALVERLSATTPVRVDPARLEQVLANLLDNALRHTPAGGTVTLDVETRGRRAAMTVSDTGEGIAAEHLPHVFTRFYRAERERSGARGGSGIGLTISRALVEAHGGSVTARSEGPGKGATITVLLPLA